MSQFPSRSSNRRPQIVLTDRYEIRFFHDAGIVKFYSRRIELGEIISAKNPSFVLRVWDFRHHPEQFSQMVEILTSWREVWDVEE